MTFTKENEAYDHLKCGRSRDNVAVKVYGGVMMCASMARMGFGGSARPEI